MAMIYTLVSSAKDWLTGLFARDNVDDDDEEEVAKKHEVIVPHGEPVTIDTFLAWRDRYEAELALERAKLMPESALASTKENKLNGRQWFETVIRKVQQLLRMDLMKKMKISILMTMKTLKCYCYVCDVAAPCKTWYGGGGHCHALDTEAWKNIRKDTRKITNP